MSNFSGNVRKNANSFKPQSSGGGDALVAKTRAGSWPGQEQVVELEKGKQSTAIDTTLLKQTLANGMRMAKADSPVLDTTPTPRTDGRGEAELGVSGQVDHVSGDGQAVYLAGAIARQYRQLTADGAGIENLSREERRKLRDELVRRVGATADGAQQPDGDSASAQATRRYVTEVASLLFGLIDELSETPAFLRGDTYTPDGLGIHEEPRPQVGEDYLRPVKTVADFMHMHKSASDTATATCPHCGAAHIVAKASGLQRFTCSKCSKPWQQDLSLSSTFTKSSANPELEPVKKQLGHLIEILRGYIAHGAGVTIDSSRSRDRFVTKGNDPRALLKDALEHGTPVQFSGQDPRDAAAKSGGARFQPRGSR